MADIFISYAKADHALALKLSAFLEAEGWSVWWDKSLGAADLYRDEIMKQLAAARAVITIWTENSIKSDWVRAEAGRAKAEGKLIPVKTPEVAYADIPLPFGEMHTENVASTDLIRGAIVSQLSKPTAPQSSLWQITNLFKYEALTWIGMLGSVISLFVSASVVLKLADGVRELVYNWKDWTQSFWRWLFSWISFKVPLDFVPILTFAAFAVLLVIGVNLTSKIAHEEYNSTGTIMRKIGILVVGVLSYLGAALLAFILMLVGLWLGDKWVDEVSGVWVTVLFGAPILGLIFIAAIGVPIGFPIAYLMYHVRERTWVFIASILFLFMTVCLGVAPLLTMDKAREAVLGDVSQNISEYVGIFGLVEIRRYVGIAFVLLWFVLLQVILMAVILFSPLRQLTRRLAFVTIGVLTLIALNEVSKLHLRQYW